MSKPLNESPSLAPIDVLQTFVEGRPKYVKLNKAQRPLDLVLTNAINPDLNALTGHEVMTFGRFGKSLKFALIFDFFKVP
jgi:hypothetical protein